MADFDPALERVLRAEGGISNDSHDRGGLTAYGISAVAHPEHRAAIVAGEFTKEDAAACYREDYWDALRLGLLHDQQLAEDLFDCAVNQGVSFAGHAMQDALKQLGADIALDGKVGPATIAAANGYRYPDALRTLFRFLRVERYISIIGSDESQRRYLAGWLRRV